MPEGRRVGRYPDEVRERAVRMVLKHQDEYPSQWKAIESVSAKLSVNRLRPALKSLYRWAAGGLPVAS